MTFADRTAAVVPFGFTERQARFLVTVMLHSGVCLGRQYCAFARIEYGAAVANLFKALESRGFATPQTCASLVISSKPRPPQWSPLFG